MGCGECVTCVFVSTHAKVGEEVDSGKKVFTFFWGCSFYIGF